MSDLSGKRLGQYDILGVLGEGGMATVYRARQESMEREVAIKVIIGKQANNPEFVARFEREARLIARLQHPHILPVFDFGRSEGLIYLVMRLVEGGSLDWKLRRGPLPLSQAGRMFTQICSAMTYAHENGVIHRDMKPNNILLDRQENCYLTDFGIAKLVQTDTHLTTTGAVMGTPAYMAPEQWRTETVDARTDIYALGIMLYEMLTGTLPFKADTPFGMMYKHFDEMPTPPRLLNPVLPEAVGDVINKAIAKKREDRYKTADTMADDLNAALAGVPVNIARPPAAEPAFENTAKITGAGEVQIKPTAIADPTAITAGNRRRVLIVAAVAVISALIGLSITFIFFSQAQQARTKATAAQNTLVAQAETRIAQGSQTAFAAIPTDTATPTITPTLKPSATALPPATATQSPAPTSTPTLIAPTNTLTSAPPTNTALPTPVRFADYKNDEDNIKFRYPAGWEVNETYAPTLFILSEHFKDLKIDNGVVSGPPFIEVVVGSGKDLGRIDMAKAKTPADALTLFSGETVQNLDPVLGAHFPAATTSHPVSELGVIKVLYLLQLGPDRFVVVLLQTKPEVSQQYVNSIALPLVRSVDFVAAPTQAAPAADTATPVTNVTFVPPDKYRTFSSKAFQISFNYPASGWNLSQVTTGHKPFIIIKPADSQVVIKNAYALNDPNNQLTDGPFVLIQKKHRSELSFYRPETGIIDLYASNLGDASFNPVQIENAPFSAAYGRSTAQSEFTPINGWLALVVLDDNDFLILTAQAPRSHEDDYLHSVVLPLINSLKYTPAAAATPTASS